MCFAGLFGFGVMLFVLDLWFNSLNSVAECNSFESLCSRLFDLL